MTHRILFQGWMGLARVLIVGVLAYMALVLVLRISGKRTLSKMNVFDLAVTVAPGSTLASLVPLKDDAPAGGLLAFGTLISLQFVVAWLSVRSRRVSDIVKAEPRMLFFQASILMLQ